MDRSNHLSQILFGQDLEEITGETGPEKEPGKKAAADKRLKEFKNFMSTGPGRFLFEGWKQRVKREIMLIISNPAVDTCICPVCSQIKSIRHTVAFCVEAQEMVSKKIKEEKK